MLRRPAQNTSELLSLSYANSRSHLLSNLLTSNNSSVFEKHSLLSFTSGKGTLYIQDIPVPVKKGTTLLLHPRTRIQLTGDEQLDGIHISFDVFARGCNQPATALNSLFPYGQPIPIRPFAQYVHLLEQHAGLEEYTSDELQQFRQQIIVQELIVLLLENAQTVRKNPHPDESVRATIQYIGQHYTESLTVEQLATQAGMARSQYSSRFQSITGYKPLDYITRLRIEQAKTLLMLTDDPLREIARSVGFSDEYYFNRRFSQMTGCSPKQYVRQHRSDRSFISTWNASITSPDTRSENLWPAPPVQAPSDLEHAAVPSFPSTQPVADHLVLVPSKSTSHSPKIVTMGSMVGHILTLGIRPVGAELTIIRHQVVYRNQLQLIEDVGVINSASVIAGLEPDLIIYEHRSDAMKELLEQVAPTLTINPASNTAEQLRCIAKHVSEEQRAEQWIAHYEEKHEQMWRRLGRKTGTEESATVLLDLEGEWYVMGIQGFPLTLYHPLGFTPPERVASLMKNQVRFLQIQKHELADYAGDRLFVLTSSPRRHDAHLRQLLEQTSWADLPASVRAHTYTTNAKWNFDDPITRDRLLKVMPRILKHPLT
ncbi:AraC-like DNA-binding protein [Paenibacillus pabuli]|uniref:AraC-like DNA-binding protein n=1 Tax=Paenibacillus pabuli TaxID=1472 RepID=A0ABX9BT80_9BACL|nr:AraC family transcriptional regulator [Paenibacillus pabuli]RAJ03434.1 AraC-like DNA-binding protein [Paenibacillus pabuli]